MSAKDLQLTRITDVSTAEQVRRRVTDFLEENPSTSAIVSGVNNLGLTLKTAIELLGKRVPDDISIIDFDTQQGTLAEYEQVGFSAITIPYYSMGYRAARRLIRNQALAMIKTPPEVVPSDFVLRHTTFKQKNPRQEGDQPPPSKEVVELSEQLGEVFFAKKANPEITQRLAQILLRSLGRNTSIRNQFFEMTLSAVSYGVNPFFAHAQAIQFDSVERRVDQSLPLFQRVKEVLQAVRAAQVKHGFTAEGYQIFERQRLWEAREQAQRMAKKESSVDSFLNSLAEGALHLGAVVQSVILFDYTQPTAEGEPQIQVWKYQDKGWQKHVPEGNLLVITDLLPESGRNSSTLLLDLKSPQGVMCTASIDLDCITPQNINPFGETVEPILQQAMFAESLKRTEEALEVKKGEARAAAASKNEFLTNVSHEIRTPMNGIIGIADLVLETDLTAQQREYISMIRDSGNALLTIVNDILDFSKIGSNSGLILQESNFELRKSVEDTVKTLGVRAREKGVDLSCVIDREIPDHLVGDVGRLRQVFINLIGNAIKFTDEGEVHVRAEISEQTDSEITLTFSVKDTGIGIPKDRQAKVFDSFQQVDGTTSRLYGGTGLGLSISTELVKKMNGRIWLDSVYGQGTTFYFSASFKYPTRKYAELNRIDHSVLKGKRALVAIENNHHREFIRNCFDEWGVEGVFIRAGNLILSQHEYYNDRERPFQITVLDSAVINISQADYLEGLLKGSPVAKQLILLLPVGASPVESERYTRLGASQVLSRPLTHNEFSSSCIHVVLGGEKVMARTSSELEPVSTESRMATKSMRILLVDDNEINRRVAVGILNKRQHQVQVAVNGIEAVKCFRQGRYDIILMDIQMPKMDGLEATRIIRDSENESGRHTPIIAMTAHAMNESRLECLEAGMDDFISKPLDRNLFIEMVEGFSEARRVSGHSGSDDAPPVIDDGSSKKLELKYFDELIFEEQVGDDEELIVSIIDLFCETYEELVESLFTGIEDNDSKAIHNTCHSIRNSLGPFGATLALDTMKRLIDVVDIDSNFVKAKQIAHDLENDIISLSQEISEFKNSFQNVP